MPARASLRQGRREREESNAKFAASSGQIALGSGSLVQIGVDALGQRAIDTAHARELLHARRGYAGVTAERFQQCRTARGADTGDVFQHAAFACSFASLAMAGDREA